MYQNNDLEPRLLRNKPENSEIGNHCGIPDACDREVPVWLITLDNVPTLTMYFLGAALIWKVGWIYSVLFFVYCIVSIALFWRLICPWCHHFDTGRCPCGYGKIAPRFFVKKSGKNFKNVFRRNIAVVFPSWIIPFGVGLYLLATEYSRGTLVLFVSFCIVGFVLIPAISRLVGCKSCEIKHDCPWMSPSTPH